MHTRRVATFLLGAWLACSVFMAAVVIANLRFPAHLLTAPSAPAAQLMQTIPTESVRLLLGYQAAEQNRAYLYNWELAQFPLALVLAAFLFLGTQKRILPLLLCGAMIVFVLFEHFALNPEMTYRGREADFPPGNRTFATQARVWAIEQLYIGMEGAKLLLGGVLASYLFVFRSTAVRRSRKKLDMIDHPDHSHINR